MEGKARFTIVRYKTKYLTARNTKSSGGIMTSNIHAGRLIGMSLLVAVVGIAASMLITATSYAGTITDTALGSSGPITFTEDSYGETNQIIVTRITSTGIRIFDAGGTLNEGASSCSKSGAYVNCATNSTGNKRVIWELGGGNDTLEIPATRLEDIIDAGMGGDITSCGDQLDEIHYDDRSEGIYVDADDGEAWDGEIEEFDKVEPDCEVFFGGSGPDLMYGADTKAADMWGNAGNDTMFASPDAINGTCGTGVASVLYAGEGDDSLVAETGANDLRAGPGDDKLYGADGCDVLSGDLGSDFLAGKGGNDDLWETYDYSTSKNILDGGSGQDLVFGGLGNDLILTYDSESDNWACGPGDDERVSNASDIHSSFESDPNSCEEEYAFEY